MTHPTGQATGRTSPESNIHQYQQEITPTQQEGTATEEIDVISHDPHHHIRTSGTAFRDTPLALATEPAVTESIDKMINLSGDTSSGLRYRGTRTPPPPTPSTPTDTPTDKKTHHARSRSAAAVGSHGQTPSPGEENFSFFLREGEKATDKPTADVDNTSTSREVDSGTALLGQPSTSLQLQLVSPSIEQYIMGGLTGDSTTITIGEGTDNQPSTSNPLYQLLQRAYRRMLSIAHNAATGKNLLWATAFAATAAVEIPKIMQDIDEIDSNIVRGAKFSAHLFTGLMPIITLIGSEAVISNLGFMIQHYTDKLKDTFGARQLEPLREMHKTLVKIASLAGMAHTALQVANYASNKGPFTTGLHREDGQAPTISALVTGVFLLISMSATATTGILRSTRPGAFSVGHGLGAITTYMLLVLHATRSGSVLLNGSIYSAYLALFAGDKFARNYTQPTECTVKRVDSNAVEVIFTLPPSVTLDSLLKHSSGSYTTLFEEGSMSGFLGAMRTLFVGGGRPFTIADIYQESTNTPVQMKCYIGKTSKAEGDESGFTHYLYSKTPKGLNGQNLTLNKSVLGSYKGGFVGAGDGPVILVGTGTGGTAVLGALGERAHKGDTSPVKIVLANKYDENWQENIVEENQNPDEQCPYGPVNFLAQMVETVIKKHIILKEKSGQIAPPPKWTINIHVTGSRGKPIPEHFSRLLNNALVHNGRESGITVNFSQESLRNQQELLNAFEDMPSNSGVYVCGSKQFAQSVGEAAKKYTKQLKEEESSSRPQDAAITSKPFEVRSETFN